MTAMAKLIVRQNTVMPQAIERRGFTQQSNAARSGSETATISAMTEAPLSVRSWMLLRLFQSFA